MEFPVKVIKTVSLKYSALLVHCKDVRWLYHSNLTKDAPCRLKHRRFCQLLYHLDLNAKKHLL